MDPPTQRALLTPNKNAIYNAYVGTEILPRGVNPFYIPNKYVASIQNMQVVIQANIQGQGPYNFNIDTDSDTSVAWSTNCI